MQLVWEHNRLKSAANQASTINLGQDLSSIEVGLHDEIFQGELPVLVGVDAASTYCYLLETAEHRDADTWGYHLLDAAEQGLDPTYTIADAGGMTEGRPESRLWRQALSWRHIPYPASMPNFGEQSVSPSDWGHDPTTKTLFSRWMKPNKRVEAPVALNQTDSGASCRNSSHSTGQGCQNSRSVAESRYFCPGRSSFRSTNRTVRFHRG